MQNKLCAHGLIARKKSKPHRLFPRAYGSDAVQRFARLVDAADESLPEGKELHDVWTAYEVAVVKHKAQKMFEAEAIEEDENGDEVHSDGEDEDNIPNEYDLNDEFINDGVIEKVVEPEKTKAQRAAELNAEIEFAERELQMLRAKRAKISLESK